MCLIVDFSKLVLFSNVVVILRNMCTHYGGRVNLSHYLPPSYKFSIGFKVRTS